MTFSVFHIRVEDIKRDKNEIIKKENMIKKETPLVKKIIAFVGAIALFLILAYGYMPEVLGGKIVNQSDISGFLGMSHEMAEFNKANPETPTAWTNSMFSGMPTTTIVAPESGDLTKGIYDFLLIGKRPATYLFISLLGAFLLMLSFGMSFFISIAGAIAVSFCSYNLQIIQVGHNTKMQAIAFLPWVLAAIIYTYRHSLELFTKSTEKKERLISWGKVLLGSLLFAIALSLQIKANHQQITYYLAIIIFVYAIALLVWILFDGERIKAYFKRFCVASILLLVFGLLGIATNTNKLLPLYKYAEHTMRGGSELTVKPGGSSDVNNDGLDLGYATAWSYGFEELPNLLIPNYNGGSSAGAVNPKKSEACQLLRRAGQPNVNQIAKALPMYWGPQPFTAGPMYIGAISVFLFVLALFVCDKREKWWVIIAILLAIGLGVGRNAMWFTKLWFDYVPFYNKFRTVSMALIMLQVLVPILGFLALDKILKGVQNKSNSEIREKKLSKSLLYSYLIVGGFCILMFFIPSLAGNFVAASDASMPAPLAEALELDRMSLLSADAWRSYIYITILVAVLYFVSFKEKYKKYSKYVGIVVAILVFADLFSVGKRYLNSDHFVTPKQFTNQFTLREVDKIILEDNEESYRVADLTTNIFNDSHTSYHHKSIGGYSPAKLQRYQDLIDRYLVSELNDVRRTLSEGKTFDELLENLPEEPVLSALNTKYFILDGQLPPLYNKYAFGNAWFVDNAILANSPDEEIAKIGEVDLYETAVIGADFTDFYNSVKNDFKEDGDKDLENSDEDLGGCSDKGYVEMTSYKPNELIYACDLKQTSGVVFSEVYYPEGWTAELHYKDGKVESAPIYRADWILRAMFLPKGEYELIMKFAPSSYSLGKAVSMTTSILLILLSLLVVGGLFALKNKAVGSDKNDN